MQESLESVLLGRFSKERLVSFMNNNPDQFEAAISIALSTNQPQAWRAAWLLNHCVSDNDDRIIPHIPQFISTLKERADGHQREFMKILEHMVIDDAMEGVLFDECMNLWENIGKTPSVRIVAFRTLVNMAKKYPELKNEIVLLTQDHYTESLSPGIKNSCNRAIKKLMAS
jgi:hypothetical protein